MLIGKYVFVIFSTFSPQVLWVWASEGGKRPPQDFEIWHFPIKFFNEKVCFRSFEWWKSNFATFVPPANIFLANPWRIHYWPFLEKILPALMFRGTCSSIKMLKGYIDRESLGTPALGLSLWVNVLLPVTDPTTGKEVDVISMEFFENDKPRIAFITRPRF